MTQSQKRVGIGLVAASVVVAATLLLTQTTTHAYRNDILVCGQIPYSKDYYYAGTGEDFMKAHNLQPGDTVAIKTGPNGEDTLRSLDLGLASLHDLVFINDRSNTKPVNIGWFGLGNNCYNIKMLGNGSPSVKYGFKFYDPNHFGLSWGCVGDLEAAWLVFDGCLMSAQLVTIPGTTYPVSTQKLSIHDIISLNSNQESFYFGYVRLSPIQMDLQAYNLYIRNSGRDGIQTRNTKSVRIWNCDLDSIGMLFKSDPNANWGQNHGILFSNVTDSGTVRNCKLNHVTGNGIWSDGFGDYVWENNNIQSDGETIFIRAYNPGLSNWGDDNNTGYEKTVVRCNTLRSGKGVTLELMSDTAAHKSISFTATNNNCENVFHIPVGVTASLSNNGTSVVPCSTPVPPNPPIPPAPSPKGIYHRGYWTINNKRVYYVNYTDGTWTLTNGKYVPL
jgi:hypothetical protein